MPSSYTAPIYDGEPITFEVFVLRCARGMGACVTIRDEPLDVPPPEAFAPDPYYSRAVEKAEAEWRRLSALSPAELHEEIDAKYSADLGEYIAGAARAAEIRARYSAMLTQVEAWDPPTPDHAGLKGFMLEQIRGSSESDGYPPQRPAKPSPDEVLDRAKAAVSHAWESLGKEARRVETRNAWLRALRASLATQ